MIHVTSSSSPKAVTKSSESNFMDLALKGNLADKYQGLHRIITGLIDKTGITTRSIIILALKAGASEQRICTILDDLGLNEKMETYAEWLLDLNRPFTFVGRENEILDEIKQHIMKDYNSAQDQDVIRHVLEYGSDYYVGGDELMAAYAILVKEGFIDLV